MGCLSGPPDDLDKGSLDQGKDVDMGRGSHDVGRSSHDLGRGSHDLTRGSPDMEDDLGVPFE